MLALTAVKRGADYIGGLASPITAFLILSLLLLTSQTWGQTDTSGTDEERTWHEEIIVTAEKVEENILDVPMTISAFDSKSLKEHVLQDKTDLQSLVPGLQFGDEMDQEGQGTVIRGIGTRIGGQSHADRAVANYIDGAYTVGIYGSLPGGAFDLERVEVARGPQGTLNGRNSIAGSVNMIYKKPSDEWDAEIMTEVTDVSQQRLNVAIGGPVSDTFSFRLTAGIHTGDGKQKNRGLGGDYDKPDHTFYAPQLRFKTDRFDMNVRYSHVEDKGTSRSLVTINNLNTTDPFVTLGPHGGLYADAPPGTNPTPNHTYLYATPNPAVDPNCPVGKPGFLCGVLKNEVALNYTGWQDSKNDMIIAYAQYDITEELTLRYSFSDSDVQQINAKDADYTNRISSPDDLTLASDGLVSPFEETHYVLPYIYDEQSHELQISSSFDGPFNFIAGIFAYENSTLYDLERHDRNTPYRFGTADEQAAAAGSVFGVPVSNCQDVMTGIVEGFGIGTSDPAESDDWEGLFWFCPEGADHTFRLRFLTGANLETEAAFFNGTYEIDDHWTVSGGLRYTKDDKSQNTSAAGGFAYLQFGAALVGVAFEAGGDPVPRSWDATIGHISLEYNTDTGNLIYGRLSTGYRAGAFGTPIPGVDLPQVGEEKLVNYEAGIKGLYLEDRLQIALGFWFNDFEGFQLAGQQPAPPGISVAPFSSSPLLEYTSNIDDTQIWGADFEFSYYMTDEWRLSGFYAFQGSEIGPHESVVWDHPDTEYAQWEHVNFETGQMVTSQYALATDMTGNRLPMQPEDKIALTLAYERSFDNAGNLQLQTTYMFTDDQHPNIGNVPDYVIPSYERWDAGAIWTPTNNNWSLHLFVQNIFNEIGLVEFLPISGLGSNPSLGYLTHPREVGVQVRWMPFD